MAATVQFLATTATVPWSYSIIGIVRSVHRSKLGNETVDECLNDITKQANEKGAQAVIGIQVALSVAAANQMITVVTGTAIRWTTPAQ